MPARPASLQALLLRFHMSWFHYFLSFSFFHQPVRVRFIYGPFKLVLSGIFGHVRMMMFEEKIAENVEFDSLFMFPKTESAAKYRRCVITFKRESLCQDSEPTPKIQVFAFARIGGPTCQFICIFANFFLSSHILRLCKDLVTSICLVV